MEEKNNTVRISEFLSLVLRHQPEKIGLHLDAGGWAVVDELLEKSNRAGVALDREFLEYVVSTNDKKRFSFSNNGQADLHQSTRIQRSNSFNQQLLLSRSLHCGDHELLN